MFGDAASDEEDSYAYPFSDADTGSMSDAPPDKPVLQYVPQVQYTQHLSVCGYACDALPQ